MTEHVRAPGNSTLVDALRNIQDQAGEVTRALRHARDQLPEETDGWDVDGAANVQLDRLGVPVGIRIADDWAARTSPSTLGAAVVQAAAVALRAQSSQIADALADPGARLTSAEGFRAVPATPAAVPVQPVATRPLDELAEGLFTELRSARELNTGPPAPARGVGRAAQGAVVVEVGATGLMGCEVDHDWVQRRTGLAISLVLGQALTLAVDDLADATSRSPQALTARRLDGLLAEAMAHLTGPAGPA